MFIILVSIVATAYLWATLTYVPAGPGGAVGPQPEIVQRPHPATMAGSTTHPVVQKSPAADAGEQQPFNSVPYMMMVSAVVIAFLIITMDLLVRRKNLAALSGLFFGLLVGVIVSVGLSYLIDSATRIFLSDELRANYSPLIEGTKVLLGLMCCYLTVSFILQTKDDFRFIIPYVEFARATRGPRPMILDTSVIIDGRIADMATTGLFEAPVIVPRFVLNELQVVADSSDKLKRSRGRRGLDILEKLKAMPKLELRFWEGTLTDTAAEAEGVDHKLVALAQQENARIVTNDFNLNKVASLRGVTVININSIADALKPVALPGETMKLRIVRPGEGPTQGVGYLEDGTMVVVDGARDKVGQDIEITVTNALQTNAGKMIFGKTDSAGHAPPSPRTPRGGGGGGGGGGGAPVASSAAATAPGGGNGAGGAGSGKQ
ncbi:MAG TPA: PIN domain-containing protein [Phycisphaerae bacterium]|nr:PIN domain-containing protein [Phycisphaerae bacterium]